MAIMVCLLIYELQNYGINGYYPTYFRFLTIKYLCPLHKSLYAIAAKLPEAVYSLFQSFLFVNVRFAEKLVGIANQLFLKSLWQKVLMG